LGSIAETVRLTFKGRRVRKSPNAVKRHQPLNPLRDDSFVLYRTVTARKGDRREAVFILREPGRN